MNFCCIFEKKNNTLCIDTYIKKMHIFHEKNALKGHGFKIIRSLLRLKSEQKNYCTQQASKIQLCMR